MIGRIELAVLQMEAAQAAREVLDSFYQMFEGQQQQPMMEGMEEQNGLQSELLLSGEEGRNVEQDRPISVW